MMTTEEGAKAIFISRFQRSSIQRTFPAALPQAITFRAVGAAVANGSGVPWSNRILIFEAEFGDSDFGQTVLGVCENGNGLLKSNAWKPFEKFTDRRAGFEVLKQLALARGYHEKPRHR